MKKLENPQQAIYEYLVSYYNENGYPPSVREIGEAVGLKSTSTVHVHLKNMERKGLIARDSSKQRAVVITNLPGHGSIPLVGKVAAGSPILAVENIEESFPVPAMLLHNNTGEGTFMLRVEGDSMVDAGICTGDVIVVDASLSCEDGDIVVARTQQESATVKRLYRENGQVRLQPENERYQPLLLPYDEVEIVGKVIGLMRRM